MYVEIYDNLKEKKLGTVSVVDGKLDSDSADPFVLGEIAYFESMEDFTPELFFKKLSQRFETATTYLVFNDEGQRVRILNDDTVAVFKDQGE